MALWLKQSTAETVTVGPALDITDGVTPVTTLASGTVDEIGVYKEDGTALVDLSGLTLTHRAGGVYTFPLSTASTDTVGRLYLYIRDDSACLPIWHEFMVLDPEAYDAVVSGNAFGTDDKMLISTDAQDLSATLDVNTKTLTAGAVTAAAIATGAIDADAVATDAVDEIVDGVWDEALSGHNTGGSAGKALRNAGGIVLDTGTADAGAANTIDLETGVANTNDDFYNHTVIIITGGTGAGQERIITDYVGSTQQATVTPAWISGLEPDATSEYEIIPGTVHAETQGGGYAGGAVWIGPSGSTGTQLYVDGTVDNPIDDGSMANAKIVADALNLRIFRIEPTSSITLGETFNGYTFEGVEYTLDLGTQDVSNSYISGASIAASTATGTGTIYNNCIFDNAVTLAPCVIRNSYIGDTTVTAGSAGNFFINHCVSRAAGNAVAPNFDFGALLNASNLNVRDWSGGLELENMGAGTGTYNASIEGQGNITINANCSATSNLAIRGMFTLTDNAGGAVTVSDDARIDVAQINAEVVDVIDTDAGADPSAVPATTAGLRAKIDFVCAMLRNKVTQTATQLSLRNDADSGNIGQATVSDDATTATRGKIG